MACLSETDYFRELDFLDFPSDDKMFPVPHFQPYPQPYYMLQQPQQNQNYLTQVKQDDLFSALNFDAEDRELLGSLEPLPSSVKLETMRGAVDPNLSCDTIDVFEFSHGLKRERPVETCENVKKAKLSEFDAASNSSHYKFDADSTNSGLKYKTKQKRTKWLRKEVQALWEGIAMYGNNWRLIKKKAFGHRTYYQVKDKGRRILSSQGWSSGRTKATHDGASEEAKLIAEKVLVSSEKANTKSEESSVVAGSTASIPSTAGDSELDFDIDFDC